MSHRSEGCPISSEVPCFISKGGPCMKQVPVPASDHFHFSRSKPNEFSPLYILQTSASASGLSSVINSDEHFNAVFLKYI